MSENLKTPRQIHEAMKGQGRVYLHPDGTKAILRVFGARVRSGGLQVKTQAGWHTVKSADEIWSVE
jgi:predicted flavoprotein YhiN